MDLGKTCLVGRIALDDDLHDLLGLLGLGPLIDLGGSYGVHARGVSGIGIGGMNELVWESENEIGVANDQLEL